LIHAENAYDRAEDKMEKFWFEVEEQNNYENAGLFLWDKKVVAQAAKSNDFGKDHFKLPEKYKEEVKHKEAKARL